MNWKCYSLSYSFISLQARTEPCTVTSQAVICFVTEKKILFSKIISWTPLQATKEKQNSIIQPNVFIKGIHKGEQKPDSSALVRFEAGLGNLDLWEFDANSGHLFTAQHHLKLWGWGGGAEAALLQPCPQTIQCSFRTPEHLNSQPRHRQAELMWILCGSGEGWCVVTVTLGSCACWTTQSSLGWPAQPTWPFHTWAIFLTNSTLMKYSLVFLLFSTEEWKLC